MEAATVLVPTERANLNQEQTEIYTGGRNAWSELSLIGLASNVSRCVRQFLPKEMTICRKITQQIEGFSRVRTDGRTS